MAEAAPPVRRGGHGIARALSFIVIGLTLLTVLGFAALRWIDSDAGRAFVVRQLPLVKPQSGLRITAGRIDGSLFGKAVIHDMVLSDPRGRFAEVPRLALDWRPLDLINKTFRARDIAAPVVRILRAPALNPSTDDRILPDFDFDIGRLAIDRLILEAPVSGQRRVLSVGGNADIRDGRVKARLVALTLPESGLAGSGDTLRLVIDAEPDANRFDLDGVIKGPANGAIAGLLGLNAPLAVTLAGDGAWQAWQGRLDARLGGKALANLALTAAEGRFTLKGSANAGLVLTGVPARLAAPLVRIDASAVAADGKTAVTADLASSALSVTAKARLDIGAETIDSGTITARLLAPAALHPKIGGRNVSATGTLGGRFADPVLTYRLTTASAAWSSYVAEGLAATGTINLGSTPLTIQVAATARRVTGVAETAAPLLTNVRASGAIAWADGRLTSNAIGFRSDKLSGQAVLTVVPARDDYLIAIKGLLPRYVIPQTGLADISADVRVTPSRNGARVAGRTTVRLVRIDNGFFAALTDGLPVITSDLDIADDLSLAFRNTRLVAPGLTLSANGTRSAAGLDRLSGAGTSRAYGPLTLALAGPIDAPVVDVVLQKPGFGIGLTNLSGHVAPAVGGWSFTADGASSYGPVAGRGLIRTATDPVTIEIERASIVGMIGQGRIVQTDTGPFAGRIGFAGSGLTGVVQLAAAGAVQRADVDVTANEARIDLVTPISIDRGRVQLSVLLPDSGPSASGSFTLSGVERDGLRLDTASGTLRYANGDGQAKLAASGTTTIPFTLTATADLGADEARLIGSGTLDGKPVTLSGPAVFTRDSDGWRLAPVSIITPDGKTALSGIFGSHSALKANFDRVSLSLLTVALPALDVSGRVSGTIDIDLPAGGTPTGTAALRINHLSRAGIASSSAPIDVGINANLSAAGSVARAVIVRGGKVEGRMQARIGPIPAGSGTLTERLFASPVVAQLRYNGPAQALWGLSGVEAMDVRGPISVAADVSGLLGNPQISGTARSEGARVEAVSVGAVIDQVSLDSRFTASRLELTRFSGRVGKDGSIIGTGGIDLSGERGFPMDIRLRLKNAQLVNRDDFTGSATGTVRIATDQYGGVVSGKLVVDKATYRIGRGSAIDVPTLYVTEKNTRVLGRRVVAYAPPTRWLLNLDISGDRRLFLSGMGIEAEWRANVKVKGGATTPEVSGRVQLVRGDYDFAGKRFSLTKGDVRFQGVFPPDPIIDIAAESSAQGFTAQLAITGTAQRPQIAFSSVPALPEDEVLSRVLFGSSVTDLSAPEALQLAAALASLRGGSGGLNPINMVKKGLGIDRLRILPADTTTGRKTAVAAGQYIGRSVYVELATDAQGYSATNIEISLTRSLSILSQVATLGGTSANLRWKKDY
ncbi:MAG: hypothetical protein CFE37_07250 [Alphaproteobacteria bacterium PA4]|nr:MAG: hypothetical protein CFE37_07250 [Alphaproteobacteria bacterium PA4]